MKFSVNWLREFVDLPESIDQLAETLTLAGVEIEGIERHGADFDKVVVAQITATSRHPNADRLSVCRVDDGSGQFLQIVCGATNYKEGDKVPLALPGARLPNGLEIRKSKLRGVESEGMLCSPIELGLGTDTSGLLILSPEAQIGAPIGSVFPADTILDVEITPNRGDLLSHYGLAREIAALLDTSLREARGHGADASVPLNRDDVKIIATDDCPFFSARTIENVTVAGSPDWLRAKLESVGIRSINNIVDISNFVMLELGQPTHAFDADKLRGSIDVRPARDGEKFLALDGRTYSLNPENVVIADNERAVGIGGVMGGEETGVSNETRNILLESAYFRPASIRRTARELNLPSDASYRFERGVDPRMVLRASARATELIRELAGGQPADRINAAGELPPPPADVTLRYERVNRLVGETLPSADADQILGRFRLTKTAETPGSASWKIPSHRSDLQREADLIEEIVRVHGIDRIAGRDRSLFTPASHADRIYNAEVRLRQTLTAGGISEARTSALISRAALDTTFGSGAIELRNPLSEDHVALRPSLIPGLLQALERNVRAGVESIRLFELGRVFSTVHATERRTLGLLFCGRNESESHWRQTSRRRLDFFDLKGAIESISRRGVTFRRSERSEFALVADLFHGDKSIGFAGQMSEAIAPKIGASAAIFIAEIDLSDIISATDGRVVFAGIDKFPAVQRDIAMIVPETVAHAAVEAVILHANEPLLEKLELFDLFTGDGAEALGAGRKSLAYTLTYRDKNRTLTNDEIAVVHARIRERLKSELGAELRE